MANILGVQTVDGIYILNVDTDPSTGLGTSAPLGSFAIASDGSGFFYKSGALDADWNKSLLAPLFGVVRYVYLVNDASDATKLGGTANNVYTTFQAAYDAANTLQVALGGLNRVIIMVGNTVAATVGNLSLSASWNTLVNIVGIGKERSLLGNITVTGVFTCNPTIINAAVGNITAEGGISILLNNSVVGTLNTSSTTGASGNIAISNSNNSTIGSITSSSILGNVGTLTFSNCNNITITAAVSMTQTATTGTFNIGLFSMTNCYSIRFGSTVTITMASSDNTGTIAGVNINVTNQDIIFSSNFRVTGYANNTNTSSDVVIITFACFNCYFISLFINNRTTGFNTWEGGSVTTLNFQKCVFRSRVRISYNNTTEVTTGATFRMFDCQLLGSTDGSSLDFYVLTKDISFDSFVIQGIESNFQGSAGYDGLSVSNVAITTPTVPFTIDGVSAIFSNINGYSFLLDLYNPTIANSTYDAIVSGCNCTNLSLQIAEGDINFKVVDSSASNNYYLIDYAGSGVPPIKRTELIGCNFNNDFTDLSFYGQIPVTLKNSYLGYYTNILNPQTQDIVSYNSFIESFAETGSVTTWTGIFNTSTLRRLITDDVIGVTFNNSYDEAY